MISKFRLSTVFSILAVGIVSVPLAAQTSHKGRIAVMSSAGFVTGLGGTHGALSGGALAALTDQFWLSGEVMYVPLGGESLDFVEVQSEFNARAIGFNFGGQYELNRSNKLKPYFGAGVGLIHSSSDSSVTATVAGFDLSSGSSDTNAFLSLSGGARYYMSERFGFQPDLTLFLGHRTFARLSGGVFFQFGK